MKLIEAIEPFWTKKKFLFSYIYLLYKKIIINYIVFQLRDNELGNWMVVKISPAKKFGKILKFLAMGKYSFWSMATLQEVAMCRDGETIVKVWTVF